MGLTSRRSQPPLPLSVPLSRFTSRVGGGSAFFVRSHLGRAMKHICLFLLTLALFSPMLASADRGVTQFTDLDSFIKDCKVSFIGECLPIDETKVGAFTFFRQMRIVSVLQSGHSVGETVNVAAGTPLVPGRYYLICGDELSSGTIRTWWLQEGDVEIQVWGETKDQKDYQLAGVINGLDGKSFKEKLQIIFKRRQDQLKTEEEKAKREAELLEKAL